MAIEWEAQTDVLICINCGKNINPGEFVFGDIDEFSHKDPEDCEKFIRK